MDIGSLYAHVLSGTLFLRRCISFMGVLLFLLIFHVLIENC